MDRIRHAIGADSGANERQRQAIPILRLPLCMAQELRPETAMSTVQAVSPKLKPGVMHSRISTRDVDVDRRFDYWVEMLGSTYVKLDSSSGNSADFYGSITRMGMGEIDLSCVQSTSPLVRRTRRLASEPHEACILVHCVHAGMAKVEQRGRLAQIASGDITVYLSSEPYDLVFNEWSDTRVLKIPLSAIKPYVRNLEDLTAQVIRRTSTEAAMLRGMMSNLWDGRYVLSASSMAFISDALVQTTAAGLQAACNGANHSTNHGASNLDAYYVAKAKAIIQRDIRQPSLNTAAVAMGVGISTRHLSRLFEAEALSVSRMIWTERLEGCRREIARSWRAKRSLNAVAFDWGFNNASHFSKAFRAHFGVSPSAYVRQLSMDFSIHQEITKK